MKKIFQVSARHTPLLPGWQKLWDWIVKKTGRGKPNSAWRKVGKLAAWCSIHGIDFRELNTKHTEAFYAWLMKESDLKRPKPYYWAISRSWKDLREQGKVLFVEFYKPSRMWSRYGVRIANMPVHLRDSLKDLEARAQDGQGENRSLCLKETTRTTVLGACERYFGFVQNELGRDLSSLTIDQLFQDRELLTAFHEFKVARKNGKVMVGHLDELQNLKWVAEKYVSPFITPIDMQWLAEYIRKAKKTAERRPDYGQYVTEKDVDHVIETLNQQLVVETQKGFLASKRLPLARDIFAIQFFFDHGNRTSDLVCAKWDEEFVQKDQDIQCHFDTKNNPNDRITLSVASANALKKYEEIKVEMGIQSLSILVTRNGRQIRKEQLHEQIKNRFENILKIKFSTHWFRYTFLTGELNRHGDPILAALRLGNKSLQTAQRHYDRLAPEQAAVKWHEILYAELKDGPGGLLHWAEELIQRAKNDTIISNIIQRNLQNQEESNDR